MKACRASRASGTEQTLHIDGTHTSFGLETQAREDGGKIPPTQSNTVNYVTPKVSTYPYSPIRHDTTSFACVIFVLLVH